MIAAEALDPEWDAYVAELRADAHLLIAWGHGDVHHALLLASDEYEITGLLAQAMDVRLAAPKTPERFMLYSIHNEKPTSPSGELGKRRPKLDIQVERCGLRRRPQFTFEAKRMRDDAGSSARATMREYLGDDGILRFVKGRYAFDATEAAMLGCLQAHDAEFWSKQIDEAFQADAIAAPSVYSTIHHLHHVNVIPELADEYVSVHARAKTGPIAIFHVFIDCQTHS